MKKNIMNFFKIEKKLSVSFLWLVVSTILITFWLLAPFPTFVSGQPPPDSPPPDLEEDTDIVLTIRNIEVGLTADGGQTVMIEWSSDEDPSKWRVDRCDSSNNCVTVAASSDFGQSTESRSTFDSRAHEIIEGENYTYNVIYDDALSSLSYVVNVGSFEDGNLTDSGPGDDDTFTLTPGSGDTIVTTPRNVVNEMVNIKNPLNVATVEDFFRAILAILLIIAVPLIVFFIIYAGFLYVTARGNEEKLTTANRALFYAILGGLLILGANILINIISGTIETFTTSPGFTSDD